MTQTYTHTTPTSPAHGARSSSTPSTNAPSTNAPSTNAPSTNAPSTNPSARPATGRVLVVDDDQCARAAMSRCLRRAGMVVSVAGDGDAAVEWLESTEVDVIVSDVAMPNLDGLSLLQWVRERRPSLPVILTTGEPSVGTVMEAMEKRAFAFLPKPVAANEMLRRVADALSEHRRLQRQRELEEAAAAQREAEARRQALGRQFDRALQRLVIHYQPLVRWSTREVAGHEALVRSEEPELRVPPALFAAARELDRAHDLGRRIRELAAQAYDDAPEGWRLFVNLAEEDLEDPELYAPEAPLSRHASRVVLEISESARVSECVTEHLANLRALGFRAAVDDVGAGYAGLNSIARFEPETIKIDMELVRDVHLSKVRQRLIRSLVVLAEEMGIEVIAEGIECREELDTLVEIGCDLFQGYYFAKPSPTFVEPAHLTD